MPVLIFNILTSISLADWSGNISSVVMKIEKKIRDNFIALLECHHVDVVAYFLNLSNKPS